LVFEARLTGEQEQTMATRAITAAALVSAAVMTAGIASADPMPVPQIAAPCSADFDGAMTLLPDEQTYVICEVSPVGHAWSALQTPFDPNDTWLSYGPEIQLHGQGMRNPNLSSGRWTATPLDPTTVCQAREQTVVEAGVLSDPQVFAADPGQPLSVQMLPKLFYVTLSGTCLWTKD
jgi:hypothetical protein